MCIAVPGRLISREGDQGRCDVRGNVVLVELGLVDADIGDYLLIHAGCAIQKVEQEEAREILELLSLVDAYAGNA
ncbi:MAG: HypC/HybG/HupF family hydrogenase formation chaperone [Clostridiales bacterium]|nr:HypC/HybG/HupF family hydrogenase formation chaperone [Clostridiales bacterium]